MRLSLRRSWTRLLMDFSRTLSGITIEGRSPLPTPRYRVVPLKTFRHGDENFLAAAHLRTFLPRAAHSSAVSMERKKVGEVFHFYGKIGVAAIKLTDSTLAIGDTVQIQGPTTNVEQTVDTLQIEHADVSRADVGQEVGMKVRERVRERDFVYKLVAEGAPAAAAPVRAPPAKAAAKAPAKARPAKKRPAKKKRTKKPASRKASRAPRSKGRRGSRGSRSSPRRRRATPVPRATSCRSRRPPTR